mgnify:CR=1 FL=1
MSDLIRAWGFDFALACSAFWTQRYVAATERSGPVIVNAC